MSEGMKVLRVHRKQLGASLVELAHMQDRFQQMYPSYTWAHEHIAARVTDLLNAIEETEESISTLNIWEAKQRKAAGIAKAAATRERRKQGKVVTA